MSGIIIRAEITDNGIRAKLTALTALGRNPADAMRDIATYGKATTRERFRMQIGPDGNRWKPSLRVQLHGGKTLTKDGRLGDTITSRSGSNFAEWGSNRIYAAIHQLGFDDSVKVPAHTRIITSAFGRKLRFGVAVSVAAYTLRQKIVPRPYLGVNDENSSVILDILQARIEGAH